MEVDMSWTGLELTFSVLVYQIQVIHHALIVALGAAVEDCSKKHKAHHDVSFVGHNDNCVYVQYKVKGKDSTLVRA